MSVKVSRNERCRCGSGKKFKRCCMRARGSAPPRPPAAPRVPASAFPGGRMPRLGQRVPDDRPQEVGVRFYLDDGAFGDVIFTRPAGWLRANRAYLDGVIAAEDDPPAPTDDWRLIRVHAEDGAGNRRGVIFWEPGRWVEAFGVTPGEPATVVLGEFRGTGRVVGVERSAVAPGPDAPRVAVRSYGPPTAGGTTSPIESFRVGDPIATYSKDGAEAGEEAGDWEPVLRYKVRLRHRRRGGGEVRVVLLRTWEWVTQAEATPGRAIDLLLPEMGVWGASDVLTVEPCVVLHAGPVVTGTFEHDAGEVGELVVEGEPEPIRVTPGHLFWSADRVEWVPVDELEPGEQVEVWDGLRGVVSFTPAVAVEPVYNLEVEGDHCYRVGQQGILVHNASAPPSPSDCVCPAATRKEVTVTGTAGTFDVILESNEATSYRGQSAVCRIWEIAGPIAKHTRPGSQVPEEAMKDLLCNSTAFRGKYDPGHLIAATLGGPHLTENLVPLIQDFNRGGAWRSFEDRVGKCLEDPLIQSGIMTVTLEYGNTGEARYVPTLITASVEFTGRERSGGPLKKGGPIVGFRNRSGDPRKFAGRPCFAEEASKPTLWDR